MHYIARRIGAYHMDDLITAPNLERGVSRRAHALITDVYTTWKKKLELFCIYEKVNFDVRCERSAVDERDLSHMV